MKSLIAIVALFACPTQSISLQRAGFIDCEMTGSCAPKKISYSPEGFVSGVDMSTIYSFATSPVPPAQMMWALDGEIMAFENLGPQPRCGNTAVNPLSAHETYHEGIAVRPPIHEIVGDLVNQLREVVEKHPIFRDCMQVPPVFAGW